MPEYMEDGTPKVTIPDHVLLHGLQNHKEYVIGQFYRCLVPSGGLVYAVLNRLWGRKCEIFVRKLGEFSYIFHIPDETTRKLVLQRSLWHVDDCIMFVAPWTSSESLTLPEITSIPLWVTLKNIPSTLYSIFGIEWIASGLGEPMLSHKPWLDPTMFGEAKIMVEVELNKPFPQKVAAWDKQGNFSMVDVEYSWLPTSCERCGQLGHKQKRCLSMSGQKTTTSGSKNKVPPVANVFTSSVDAEAHDKETQRVPTHAKLPLQEKSTTGTPTRSSSLHGKESNGNHVILPKPATHKDDTPQSDEVFTPNRCDNVIYTDADALVSLATISILENMYMSPTIMCMNETTDSPLKEAAPTSTDQQLTAIRKENSRIGELGLGTNKFASLVSSDGEEEDQLNQEDCTDSVDLLTPLGNQEDCTDSVDLLTPLGKRLLRERPVKPSAKAKELQLQSTSRGRGNRGRGNRGRLR